MVITPRAGGLGLGCPLGQRWGGDTLLTSSRSPRSWALQQLPPSPEWAVPHGHARLEKTSAKETLPLCFPKAGAVAGELQRAGESAPSPLACETAAAGPCDGSCLLSATIKALEQ